MIVYKITNKANNQCYIGKTSKKLSDRWTRHQSIYSSNRLLKEALKTFGKEQFVLEVLGEYDSRELCDQLEKDFIRKYDSISPNGYNLTDGGTNCKYSHNAKMKGRGLGIPLSEERKTNISLARKGCKPNSGSFKKGERMPLAQVKKSADSHRGKKYGPEFCKKMSAIKKAYWEKRRTEGSTI